MSISTKQKGKIRLIGCGGCGTNIASQLEHARDSKEAGFAGLDIRYVDTSRSNLHDKINPDHCYILEELDGSGKVRSENAEAITRHARAILQKFPEDVNLNIVVSSGSGGSGSVIAPLLVRELIQSDIPTIVIMIGSAETRLDAKNTLNTIKSYDSISQRTKTSIMIGCIMNNNTRSRVQADGEAKNLIMSLCMLFSRENRELDTQDLFNWSRPERATEFNHQLMNLTMVDGGENSFEHGIVVSVATLAKPNDQTSFLADKAQDLPPEYQVVGYLPDDIDEAIVSRSPIHFVTSGGAVNEVADALEKTLKKLDDFAASRQTIKSIVKSSDNADDSGMIY